jgi:hypothetical protein
MERHLGLLVAVSLLLARCGAQLPPRIDLSWFDEPPGHPTRGPVPFAPSAADDVPRDPDAPDVGDKHTLLLMKELSAACKTNPRCVKMSPFEKIPCIRKCVSDNCYAAVYAKTPLEVGEVDVNYARYKRCFLNTYKNKYRSHVKRDDASFIVQDRASTHK